MVESLNNMTPQLVDGFHTESNMIRYLRNAELDKKWVTTPLKNISTALYNFEKLVMTLNESMQLEQEISKTSISSKTYYGQFTTHPKDVFKYESSHASDSRNHGEY